MPRAAFATILADWSLDELISRADRVVIGVVDGQRTVFDGRLLTESTIRVERSLMGEPAERLIVTQLGGRRAGSVTEVVGTAPLRVGQRVLLIVHTDGGRHYLVGMALGAYRLDGDRLSQRIDVSLAGADGLIKPPPHSRHRLIEEVEAAIRKRAQ